MVLKYRSMRKEQKEIPGVWTYANQYATSHESTQPISSESAEELLNVYASPSDIQRKLTAACKLEVCFWLGWAQNQTVKELIWLEKTF